MDTDCRSCSCRTRMWTHANTERIRDTGVVQLLRTIHCCSYLKQEEICYHQTIFESQCIWYYGFPSTATASATANTFGNDGQICSKICDLMFYDTADPWTDYRRCWRLSKLASFNIDKFLFSPYILKGLHGSLHNRYRKLLKLWRPTISRRPFCVITLDGLAPDLMCKQHIRR